MQNLTLKIQQLAKGLNKFTLNDIQQLIPIDISKIKKSIKQLEENSFIKKLANEEYLYTKLKTPINLEQLGQSKLLNPQIKNENNSSEEIWLTIDEVAQITGESKKIIKQRCINGTYECKFNNSGQYKEYFIKKSSFENKQNSNRKLKKLKINYLKNIESKVEYNILFKNKEEQKIFDSAYDFQKKYIVKYLAIFKLAGKLIGYDLKEFLKKLSEENPQYKTSYSTFLRRKNDYKKFGVKGLLVKLGNSTRGKSVLPQDMYEDFKQIYLSPQGYSLTKAVKELEKLGYPEEIIPSFRTFERVLLKEYSKKYINKQRKIEHFIADLDLNLNNHYQISTQNITPLYENFVDAADDYINKYAKNKSELHICRRGYIKNHLIPYFKDYKFSDIKSSTINEFITFKMSEGYAIASINRFLSALSSIMNEYNIPKKHLQLSSSNLPLVSQENIPLLNSKQINTIKTNKDIELWVLCLGINPSELEALEYSDINFEKRTLIINKCIFNNRVEKYRKIYKIRTLKLPKILIKSLPPNQEGRIFKKVNITNYDTLLNTHVKLLLNKNISINLISKMLGFQKLTDFEDRFNNLLPNELPKNFEIL